VCDLNFKQKPNDPNNANKVDQKKKVAIPKWKLNTP